MRHVAIIIRDQGMLALPYAVQVRERLANYVETSRRTNTPVDYWFLILMTACHVIVHEEVLSSEMKINEINFDPFRVSRIQY
jgi:hypothetical protein